MRKLIIISCLLYHSALAQPLQTILPSELAKSNYDYAFDEISAMLKGGTSPDFKRAVFLVENAYLDESYNYQTFRDEITYLKHLVEHTISTRELLYDLPDKDRVEKFGAIYAVLTDTTVYLENDTSIVIHPPFRYDFEDFWGETDWSKMFVTKLLGTGTGNCHSLPFLYKILAEEMGETAYLAMAPNHTYIKLWTERTGWFNTELTSATFPLDAWIMASGYVHLNAIQNGLYMDTVGTKQSIAVTLTDLANGYEKKFGKDSDPEFMLKCADIALDHYPNYINAMLLKAETMKVIYERMMKEYGAESPSDLFEYPEPRAWFEEMQKQYFKIHTLGYRKMPKQMYLNWLADLKEHKEKYTNKDVIGNLSTEQE